MLHSPLLQTLPGVVHGFGTRWDAMDQAYPDLWPRRPIQHERHGTRIVQVGPADGDVGEADGMFTTAPGRLLAIATADCAPILLARRDGRAVAALHAGWRGALEGIVLRFGELLAARGDAVQDWVAAIGPTASACCYTVDPELISEFRTRYPWLAAEVSPGGRALNLPGIVAAQLEWIGIASTPAPACTMCHAGHGPAVDAPSFHSYRRDQATRTPQKDLQWSVIAIAA
ncbi:polyphenol oxidase family protein [Massilia sp. TS11]|uniref:polyphenol oxidase family protein n=1 Tax=Massilia sp. TS11 TaxID=2908003 RepID=UPI001EDBFFC0|nr:polyphenol oxidase family protein [Massilia sp. TS11]MCG2583009.1 polyphenol oxidase family protein [Massilia sp. TS11]